MRRRTQKVNGSVGPYLGDDFASGFGPVSVQGKVDATISISRLWRPTELLYIVFFLEKVHCDTHFWNKIIFSGKAHSDLKGSANRHNCPVSGLMRSPKRLKNNRYTRQYVTVWCDLRAAGSLHSYFLSAEIEWSSLSWDRNKLSSAEIDSMVVGDMWFQPDGATCHTVGKTAYRSRTDFPGRVISTIIMETSSGLVFPVGHFCAARGIAQQLPHIGHPWRHQGPHYETNE